jgi:hypothetical protein
MIDFIEKAGQSCEERNFVETPTGLRIEIFNGIAMVFQHFRAHQGENLIKAMNTYQLVHD